MALEKNRAVLMKNCELLARNELKNKGLRERIIILVKELEASCRSVKASEEQSTDLHETAKMLSKELSLAKKKSFEVEKLFKENKEENAKLLARCDELESEARLQAERALEVPPEVLKKMEDYLASEEFRSEKIKCATDRFLQGFDECVRQLKELDPNFDVARLRRSPKWTIWYR